MTDLTPEENQGGGAVGKSFPTTSGLKDSSEEDLLPSPVAEVACPHGPSTTTCSPPLVPCIAPVLDPSQVLSGLERDRLSPGRFSVDVECDSITSDYSELGGTLRDIEKDVHYLDRDTLNTVVGEEGDYINDCAFSLAQLGLRRDSDSYATDKQAHESEADFQRRLRKFSILSLAQEFALLKKVDSQACPISFHRINQGKTLRHSATPSPTSSRGQSVERVRQRTNSKSPLRKNKLPGVTATSAASSMPQPQQQQPAGIAPSSTPHATSKSSNISVQDLPINEARRRDSGSDLPANMRPERRILMQQQQQQVASTTGGPKSPCKGNGTVKTGNGDGGGDGGGGGGDGDFDVYNIENTMPDMDWKTLEQQLEQVESEEKTRLETCKNEREEIRRRLAMTDEDADHDDQDGEMTGSMLSNPRLQTSLEGAQNMQICFIPDDILDDDDDDDVTISSNATTTAAASKERLQDDLMATSQEASENESNQPMTTTTTPTTPSSSSSITLSNRRPDPKHIASRQSQLQTEATLALAQASTMARMQLEVERQTKKKSPIADMVGIPSLGNGRKLRLSTSKLFEMNVAQLQVLVNDLHSQIELLNEDLVHLLIERDDLHMEQDSMLVDIEDLTSHCPDPNTTNNNKMSHNNNNRPGNRKNLRYH